MVSNFRSLCLQGGQVWGGPVNDLERVFIGIGSNMGPREDNCRRAIEALSATGLLEMVAVSRFYETAPWGLPGQRAFVNAVVEVRAGIGPFGLLRLLLQEERVLGRRQSARWGPRVIDLDLLFYGRRVLQTPRLTLPHPWVSERAFVLRPISDIAPDFLHPVFLETMRAMLHGLGGGRGIKTAKSQSS